MIAGTNKELKILKRAADEFARKELAPNRESNDKFPFGPFFSNTLEKSFELDLFHSMLPETLGGIGHGISALCIILDSICQEDSSLGGIIFTNTISQQLLINAGETDLLQTITESDTVKNFLIAVPVFSNPGETKLTAEAKRSGDICTLSGKIDYLVLGGLAGHAIIPAKLSGTKGYSLFLVNLTAPGISKSEPVLSLGIRSCPAVDITLNNVEATLIGEAGKGDAYFEKTGDIMHIAAAAMSLGIMKGSFDEAFDYSKNREQGGQKIVNWSEIKMILSTMAIHINNADMIVSRACQAVDAKEPGWENCSRAAALSIQRIACDLTTDGIQVLGGVGYMQDFGQEKRFRDAKHIQALLGIAPMKKIRFIEKMI